MTTKTQVLGGRNVYLLPTRDGLLFAITVCILLLGAINYGNGLAYAFTFLLAAMAVVSMTAGQRNLTGLHLSEVPPQSGFSGGEVCFRVLLKNERAAPRWGITVTLVGGSGTRIDLMPSEHRVIELPVSARRRGPVAPPIVQLMTRYPFGLLRVWSRRFPLSQAALAYPMPAADAVLPEGFPEAREEVSHQNLAMAEGSDFSGLSVYRSGDNPHHIHWKAAAAGRGLLVKQFAGTAEGEIRLRLQGHDAIERRMSVLCRQVLLAERLGLRYGLDLGTSVSPAGNGARHEEHCLRQLALYGHEIA